MSLGLTNLSDFTAKLSNKRNKKTQEAAPAVSAERQALLDKARELQIPGYGAVERWSDEAIARNIAKAEAKLAQPAPQAKPAKPAPAAKQQGGEVVLVSREDIEDGFDIDEFLDNLIDGVVSQYVIQRAAWTASDKNKAGLSGVRQSLNKSDFSFDHDSRIYGNGDDKPPTQGNYVKDDLTLTLTLTYGQQTEELGFAHILELG